MLADTVKTLLLERGHSITDLCKRRGISRGQFQHWLNSPLWKNSEITEKVNFTLGVKLQDLVPDDPTKNYTLGPSAQQMRRATNNTKMMLNYPENSFGRTLYTYLEQRQIGIAAFSRELGVYSTMLPQIAKGKIKLELRLYEILCELSDTFTPFFPWDFVPGSPEVDRDLRSLVARGIRTREDINIEWPLLDNIILKMEYRTQKSAEVFTWRRQSLKKDPEPTKDETSRYNPDKRKLAAALTSLDSQTMYYPLREDYYDRLVARGRLVESQTIYWTKEKVSIWLDFKRDQLLVATDKTGRDVFAALRAIPEDYQEAIQTLELQE